LRNSLPHTKTANECDTHFGILLTDVDPDFDMNHIGAAENHEAMRLLAD